MKKPYFDEIERQIMRENDSLLADRMLLFIAMGKFKKELMKTPLLKALKKCLEWINNKLTK